MVGRVVEQLDGFGDLVGEIHHALEELYAPCVAFGAIVGLDLEQRNGSALRWRKVFPPGVQCIDDKVAGLRRTAERQMQSTGVFVDDAERSVFLLASHVVIDGLVVAGRLATAGVRAAVHRGLAVHAQTHDRCAFAGLLLALDVGEDGMVCGSFFWV
ncbi:MAG: hypothetical protein WBG92_24240 [Thiohalocapsa sp.]